MTEPPLEPWWADWHFYQNVKNWAGELMDASAAALTPSTVVYSYDYVKSQWAEEAWTVTGEQPTLWGYVGGPLVIKSSHDP